MTRPSTPAVAALVLAVVVAPVAVAALPASGTGAAAQSTEGDVQPGEQFAGAVAVQGAELDGEVEQRTFEARLERANDSNAKASVVAGEVEDIEARLAELRERKQRLQQARENGSISEGRYRAEVAGLAARIAALERRANRTATVARGLPAEALEANGVNVSAIERLRGKAANLTGPEVAEIARSIGGKDTGKSMSGRGPGVAGNRTGGPPGEDPPGRNGNAPGDGPGNDSGPGNQPGNGSASDNGSAPGGDSGTGGPPDDGSGNQSDGAGDGQQRGNPGAGDANGSAGNETTTAGLGAGFGGSTGATPGLTDDTDALVGGSLDWVARSR